MELNLNAEWQKTVADLRDAAGRSEAQAVQVANATSRDAALSALLGVLNAGRITLDMAAALYVALNDWDGGE